MAKSISKNNHAEFTSRHRAKCRQGDFNGGWKATPQLAETDMDDHLSTPGCEFHIVDIISEQSFTMSFTKEDRNL